MEAMDSAVDPGRQNVSAAAAAAAATAAALQVLATQSKADTGQYRQRSAVSPHVSP